MIRPKSIVLRSVLGLAVAAAIAEPSAAVEPGNFQQYLRGLSIGDAAGATPPPGVYFEQSLVGAPQLSGQGQVAGVNVFAALSTSAVFWSTGWRVLGANVMLGAAQSFYELGAWSSTGGPPNTGVTLYPTVHNSWLMPALLSWNLGNGFFASTAFAFYVPDGSRYNNSPNPDYWTYEPHFAVSYLANGWNLTANFIYDFNTASGGHTGAFAGTPAAAFGVGYRSGDQAFLDLTATKKFGKWELGPVGFLKWQTTDDVPGSGFSCATMAAATGVNCGRATQYGLGALVGYDFGLVNLKLYATDTVYNRDDYGGWNVWAKLAFPLWIAQPPAPPTLVHK